MGGEFQLIAHMYYWIALCNILLRLYLVFMERLQPLEKILPSVSTYLEGTDKEK